MGVQVPGLGQTLRLILGQCLSLAGTSCLGKDVSSTFMQKKDPLSPKSAISHDSVSAGW